MSNQDGIKVSTFDTWAALAPKPGTGVQTVAVKVDNKAATRQAIIVALRKKFTVKTRSDWKASTAPKQADPDWNFKSIALHHAGNSYSCGSDSGAQMRKAEKTDIDSFGHLSYHYAIGCDGIIFEALDIRYKGAHISRGNTGVIGIVMLADLSLAGEAMREEYARKSVAERFKKIGDIARDDFDYINDRPPQRQVDALFALVTELRKHFPIKAIGGHREFQVLATSEGRACPGTFGMSLVEKMRKQFSLPGPSK